jgi:hypothetical protein
VAPITLWLCARILRKRVRVANLRPVESMGAGPRLQQSVGGPRSNRRSLRQAPITRVVPAELKEPGARQSDVVNAAKFAIDVGCLHVDVRERSDGARIFA